MKKLLLFCSLVMASCRTTTPIIIRDPPKPQIDEEMTIDQYLQSSTIYAVETNAYIRELINQIIHKTYYIDLREEKKRRNDVKGDQ